MTPRTSFQTTDAVAPILWVIVFSILLPVGSTFAQGTSNRGYSAILEAEVLHEELELEPGEIVSNVLQVSNPGDRTRSFRVEVSRPNGWKRLGSGDIFYSLEPGDSLFVPIRLVPAKDAMGAQVVIHAFVFTEEGQQVAQSYFYAKSEREVRWDLKAEPGRVVYFRNGETEHEFSARLSNLGAYEQEVFMQMETIGNGLSVVDSTGEVLDPVSTINLAASGDTTLNMAVSLRPEERNFRTVSLLTHDPDSWLSTRRYSVFLRSSEPLTSDSNVYSRSSRIDFVRLPNELRVQDYGGATIPMVLESNYQNVLGKQSVLSLFMNGLKSVKQDAYLVYFSQLMFRDVYASNPFENTPWYVGYFDPKFTAEVGTVNGYMVGMNASGRGLKGSYSLGEQHEVGAFYVRSPYLQNPYSQSFGAYWDWDFGNNGRLIQRYGRNYNDLLNQVTDVESTNLNVILSKNHYVGVTRAYSYRRDFSNPDTTDTKHGYLVGLNYSSFYLNRRLNMAFGGRYNSKYFGASNLERITGNSRISYQFDKNTDIYLASNYYRYRTFSREDSIVDPLTDLQQGVANLVLSTRAPGGSFQPGLYYSVSERIDWNVHSRGITLRYAAMNFEDNTFGTVSVRAGYDDALHIPDLQDYFTFRLSGMARIRTWTLNGSYQYGAFSSSALDYQVERDIVPQMARLSLHNQHLFQNTHFVAETSVFYTYNNQFNSHSLGTYPKIYYFTSTGWRFGMEFGYNMASNNFESAYQNFDLPILIPEGGPTGAQVNQDVTVGASIRKEFGVPIPFVKSKAAQVPIQVFYDLNGNGRRDRDEPAIENVVVNIEGHEVITDDRGSAVMRNLPHGTYALDIFPLDNMKGWFPFVDDSIRIYYSDIVAIPFVRGVKVEGAVVINRQEIARMESNPMDLSNIKISATNMDGTKSWHTLTKVDGSFEFFLPNGEYILSMNAGILGESFRLAQNNIPLRLDEGIESVQTSFYIAERERRVKVKKFGEDAPTLKIGGSNRE